MELDEEDQLFESILNLKEVLMSEIDVIRDVMEVAAMYLGQPLDTGLKMLQELEPKN